jgi:hypothetical protein
MLRQLRSEVLGRLDALQQSVSALDERLRRLERGLRPPPPENAQEK